MEQILLQGAIAFAKGALGYLGGQAIGGWLRESPEQKLRELYMEACYEFFDAIGELSDEQTQALAHFFGSERVAAAASTFLGEGHVDRRAFEDEWAQLGGTRAEITRFVTVFEECFTREAQRRLRYEDQLLAGVLLSKLGPVGRPVGRSAAAELELAEQRVSRIETPGLRQLENRIDAQVSDIKARRRYKTALATLEGLRKEVDRPQIVKANPQLVAKLYTNLAVCAEKLNQLAKAERYGRRAVHLDPRDARALVNLAVVLFRRNFKNPQARQLIRKARKLDAEYRPAQLVEVGMIADSRSPAAALRVARRRPWFMQDGAGLYMYSQLSWAVGERDKATQAAQESATLEPTADHLAWAGRLLTGEEQSTTFEIKVHGASDPSKNALNQAFELLWRAADRFFEEERSDLGFAARVDSTRMLIALGRYSEAKPILQDIISKADDPRILGPTYSNLIESSLQAREQAIDIAFEAIVKVPSAPALKFSLARALIAEGRHDEARRYLREVISTRSLPGSLRLHARLMLANNFLNASQIDEARSVLKAVPAKAHPFAATSWSRLDFSEGNRSKQRGGSWRWPRRTGASVTSFWFPQNICGRLGRQARPPSCINGFSS